MFGETRGFTLRVKESGTATIKFAGGVPDKGFSLAINFGDREAHIVVTSKSSGATRVTATKRTAEAKANERTVQPRRELSTAEEEKILQEIFPNYSGESQKSFIDEIGENDKDIEDSQGAEKVVQCVK